MSRSANTTLSELVSDRSILNLKHGPLRIAPAHRTRFMGRDSLATVF